MTALGVCLCQRLSEPDSSSLLPLPQAVKMRGVQLNGGAVSG